LDAPAVLQSWPGIVHGGCLVALVDAVAERLGRVPGPRRVEGRLTSSGPVEAALDLLTEQSAETIRRGIRQDGQNLTSGGVLALPESPRVSSWTGDDSGRSLPMSDQCLACGALNPLGLQAAISFDDTGVWTRLVPRDPWRAGHRLHPALAPVLLDEVSWWLGALAMKQGGLTNRLTVSLHETEIPLGEPLIAGGRFAEVTPIDKRRTFWRTETSLRTASGRLLATGSIVFRGGPEYSQRPIPYFKSRSTPPTLPPLFPP